MADNSIFSIPLSRKRQTSMQGKFIIFSFFLFLLIFIPGSASYMILMERITHNNSGYELMKTVELERFKFEALINSEIAIALKMADSPLIKRYFSNPQDNELEKMAFEEFAAYSRAGMNAAFSVKSVFWVNDTDKIFYTNNNDSYTINPILQDNYWYHMTLYETEKYNFNINYNNDLNTTNLWINAPVFDEYRKPLGIAGTGINLSEFIDTIYRNYSGNADIYFFNETGEITGAKNINLVINKTSIIQELNQNGAEIPAIMNESETIDIRFFKTHAKNGVTVLGAIPALNWYITAVQFFSAGDSLRTGMTVLFIIMMFVIFSVFAVFNIFIARLLEPLNLMINKMSQIAYDWNQNHQIEDRQKDEIKTLSEFIDMTISVMNEKLNAERKAHESEIAKARAEAARQAIISSIEYAGKIQKNMLPPESAFMEAFSDYHCIWKPKDIVGGDMYWIKNFSEGTVLCVFDCTGHGTPGAILTMLVMATFEAVVTDSNYKDTARIVWELEKRFVSGLNVKQTGSDKPEKGLLINDGCDLAVLYIAKDGSVAISAANTNVFICDGIGVTRLKGQKIRIGGAALRSKEEIKVTAIDAKSENKYYIASDGLYEQIGGESGIPFGYDTFEEIILKNHNERQCEISEKIWITFEKYRGNNARRDDFELITFKPKVCDE